MLTTSRPNATSLFFVLPAVVALAAAALVGTPARGTAKAPAGAAPSVVTAAEAIKLVTAADGTLRFDVAENGALLAWAGEPELEDGLPVRRTAFASQGYIYPAGTLTEGNGVLADGSPEFPDKVLGQWSCWGWYAGAGAPAGAAPWLATHLFNFGGAWGAATLVSEGHGIDEPGVALERAITGGTGSYAGAGGVQRETLLGFNASDGANFRYEVRLAVDEG
jgi:hypothetical protein